MTEEEYPYALYHGGGCNQPMLYLRGIPLGGILPSAHSILPSGRKPLAGELIVCENCSEPVGPCALSFCCIKERTQ